jgi:hypothetical protein
MLKDLTPAPLQQLSILQWVRLPDAPAAAPAKQQAAIRMLLQMNGQA